jgi:REP element-mobilizing transposase RayT
MGLQVSRCLRAQATTEGHLRPCASLNWGAIFYAPANQKDCQIVEAHLMPDHVHICIAIQPKHPVASVIGLLKGRVRSLFPAGPVRERNFTNISGSRLWSTVGFELEQVRAYIRGQDAAGWHRTILNQPNKARIARRLNQQANRLSGRPSHQATRFGGV